MMKDSAAEFVIASSVAFMESEDSCTVSLVTYHALLLNNVD
jgi:hypothetical protein